MLLDTRERRQLQNAMTPHYMRTQSDGQEARPAPGVANTPWNHMPLFQVFVFLQFLDLLTTVLVLKLGGYEANPLVHYLRFGPVGGLVIAKGLVVAIGGAVIWYHRHRVVFIANYAYAGVVCWNLLAVVAVS